VRRALVFVILLLVLAPSPAQAANKTITIAVGGAVEPKSLVITEGDFVTWKNDDFASHEIWVDGTKLKSLDAGASFPTTYTFGAGKHPWGFSKDAQTYTIESKAPATTTTTAKPTTTTASTTTTTSPATTAKPTTTSSSTTSSTSSTTTTTLAALAVTTSKGGGPGAALLLGLAALAVAVLAGVAFWFWRRSDDLTYAGHAAPDEDGYDGYDEPPPTSSQPPV
jgi:plastocyanin